MDKTYYYNVPDCEHDGDIRDAVSDVEDAGGKVVDTYWDGEDCGEAYVEYTVPDGVNPDDVYRKLHSGKGFYGKCDAIARKIVAADGKNVLEDYFRFYNDGKWTVTVARKISDVLSGMAESISDYTTSLPKLEECIGYVSDVSIEELGTSSCSKELRGRLSDLKSKYSEWEEAEESDKARLSDEYRKVATDMKGYIDAFEKSCVNAVRNRYIEDEENVRNLLNVIHATGNAVMNGGTANAENSVSQLEKQ